MRDQNRPLTRIDFSLNNRKLLVLGVGSFVILLVAFALGVMVGKRLGQVACPDHLQTLATVEKEDQVYNKLKEKIDSEEDTKAEEAPALVPIKPAVEAKKPEKTIKKQETAKPANLPKKTKSNFEEEIKQIVKEQKTPAKAAPKVAKAEIKKTEPTKKVEKTLVQKTEQTKAPGGKFYAIQIFSVADKNRAEDYISKFNAFDRRKPYSVAVDIPGKGIWYRVKIGKFETKEQALAYQSIFESKTGRSGTILTLD